MCEKKDIQRVRQYRNEGTPSQALAHTHLVGAHLKLSNDFNSGFAILACVVLGSVDIAESAVTHFLQQGPSLQAGIFWEFAFAFAFLCDDPFDHRWIHVFTSLCRASVPFFLLLLARSFGSSTPSLGGYVTVIRTATNCKVSCWISGMLDGLVIVNIGVAVGVVVLRWGRRITLLVGVDRRNVGGRVTMTCLFAMPDEILQVLYS